MKPDVIYEVMADQARSVPRIVAMDDRSDGRSHLTGAPTGAPDSGRVIAPSYLIAPRPPAGPTAPESPRHPSVLYPDSSRPIQGSRKYNNIIVISK